MLFIVMSMLLIVGIAGAVVVYVAYPHRGERLPVVPSLGDAMTRAVHALPLLEDDGSERRPRARR
jgi:hypothetical protein